MIEALRAEGAQAELHADGDAIIDAIAPQLEAGDVVAILSNGGFDGIYEKLPARLRQRFAEQQSSRLDPAGKLA